jgi:hypothetical protein
MNDRTAETPMNNPLPCLVCGEALAYAGHHDPATGPVPVNQPAGTAFDSGGHYGSTLFDPMEPYLRLEIALCDPCLRERWARTRTVEVVREPQAIRIALAAAPGLDHDASMRATYGRGGERLETVMQLRPLTPKRRRRAKRPDEG